MNTFKKELIDSVKSSRNLLPFKEFYLIKARTIKDKLNKVEALLLKEIKVSIIYDALKLLGIGGK